MLAGLPWTAEIAWPGGPARHGVPGCRRVSGQAPVPGVADEAVAGHVPVPGRRAVAGDGTANWARARETSRRGLAGTWAAGSGESALAGQRTRTGERVAGLGSRRTGETAVGPGEPRARERPMGGVRVLCRAWAVAVRRRVPGAAVSRSAGSSVGGPAGGGRTSRRIVFAAHGRDDQAAWRVDGRRGEYPFSIGVDVMTRTRPAIRDAGAGKRTLTLVRGGRALGRTDIASWQRGTRCRRPRPRRPGPEPSGLERPRFRPVT